MKARHIVLIGLVVLVAACSSATPSVTPATSTSTTVSPTSTSTTVSPTSTSTTVSPTSTSTTVTPTTAAPSTTAAKEYLAAASVAVVDFDTWRAAIANDTKVSQAIGPCATYAAELTTFDNAISRIVVTGKTGTDLQALVADDQVVIKNLDSVSTLSVASLKKDAPQFVATGRMAIRAGDLVRSDLGLPPS